MRLLVTRPEPDALKLQAVLEDMGHEATVEPLLQVSFEGAERIELDGVQALAATSRNALRALRSTALLPRARALPLFTVGKATAAEARAIGFEMVVTGAGTARELITHIVSVVDPAAGLIAHLAGDTLAVNLCRGGGGTAGERRNRRHHPAFASHGRRLRKAGARPRARRVRARAAALLPLGCRGATAAALGLNCCRHRG
jgi:Uroporphyrinogen-III synthase HemD